MSGVDHRSGSGRNPETARAGAEADLRDYAPVARRIALFYARYPAGRIITELMSRSEGAVLFRACVYRNAGDQHPAATGWALEHEGDGDINTVACIENTETSAVGRALAHLGFAASTPSPCREGDALLVRGAPQQAVPRTAPLVAARDRRPRAPTSSATRRSPDEALQRRADAVLDALRLLGQAEAFGLTDRRASVIRSRLHDRAVPMPDIERIEQMLRGWLGRRRLLP